MQNSTRNAIGLPKEKIKMKFKDAIYKVYIETIITDTIRFSEMPIYHKNSVPTYVVEISCQDNSKFVRTIGKIDELNFFLDTIAKLVYHCEYNFEDIVGLFDLLSKIHNLLWWDIEYMVESVNNIVKEVTGLDLESI